MFGKALKCRKQHVYFVSYSHGAGLGSIEITLDKPIQTYNDVKQIRDFMKNEYNLEVVILNWIKLKKKMS